MWWAHQCESNTSSTWYDIGLKEHRNIKARGGEKEEENPMHEA
jgi:hypothetical protein